MKQRKPSAGATSAAPEFLIRKASWERDQAALRAVRQEVFVEEQAVPAALEWDKLDVEAMHLLATTASGDKAIGTARLVSTGQIGRMAIAADWRRHGVGRALLLRLLQIVREEGLPRPWLNAQTSALNFYSSVGFSADGEVFDEAGIPHQRMLLTDPKMGIAVDLPASTLEAPAAESPP